MNGWTAGLDCAWSECGGVAYFTVITMVVTPIGFGGTVVDAAIDGTLCPHPWVDWRRGRAVGANAITWYQTVAPTVWVSL